jgi:Flp pilus assembly pilin Flp
MTIFNKFLKDEAGAVTIDWVALTAGILLLGIALVYGIFNGGVNPLKTSINSNLSSAVSVTVGTAPTLNP